MSVLAMHPSDIRLARALFGDVDEPELLLDLLDHVLVDAEVPVHLDFLPLHDALPHWQGTLASRVVGTQPGGQRLAIEVRAGVTPASVPSLHHAFVASAQTVREGEPAGVPLVAIWLLDNPWWADGRSDLPLAFDAAGRPVSIYVLEPANGRRRRR